MTKLRFSIILLTLALLGGLWGSVSLAAVSAEPRTIVFPTDPAVTTFGDDFGDMRSGHTHEGIDILGRKMLPLYSAINGQVRYVVLPEASWGYAIILEDAEGYTYHYLHVNNDTPGTDDNNGGAAYAYAPSIERRAPVVAGQLVGWMGDSGNAEQVGAHLHFEIRRSDGTAINPYPSLVAARDRGSYNAAEARAGSPDINTDKGLVAAPGIPPCISGRRIKLASSTTVYYCGADGRRYVFPNSGVYFSWYKDFSGLTILTAEQMAATPTGGNVTYRPGVKMVKIQIVPRVYVVQKGGNLGWVRSPEVAAAIYGADWATKIDDVPDALFVNYTVGEPILSARP